jgi:ABC-type sugar transport system ATPase subunit
MVVRRLYSGNVIVNDYVVPDVKCRDIPMVGQDYVIIDYNIARIKTPTTIGISLHFTSGTT